MDEYAQSMGLPSSLIDSDIVQMLSAINNHSEDSVIFDDFAVTKRLFGGMGEVLICSNQKGSRIAIKTFQKQYFYDSRIRILFYNEIKSWARLSGLPYILPLLGIKEIDRRPYVMMPAFDHEKEGCGTLRKILDLGEYKDDDLILYMCQTILGLIIANNRYNNVIHGDLKPENILIQNRSLFITDFGLSRIVKFTDKTLASDTTWAYKAPELWQNSEKYSIQSDMYALGLIFYEFIYKKRPFSGKNAQEYERFHMEGQLDFGNPAIFPDSIEIRQLIRSCTEKKPENRPGSYQEIFKQFQQITSESSPPLYLDIFQHLYSSVHASKADSYFQQLVKPSVVKALYHIGEHEAALEEIQLIDEKLLDKGTLSLYGNLLSLNGQDERALEIFDKIVETGLEADELMSVLSDKALSYTRLRKFDEAEQIYLDLIKKAPASDKNLVARLYSNLALTYMRNKDFYKSIQCLRSLVLDHNIHNAVAYANMGICYMQLKNYDLAVNNFRKALQMEAKPEFQTYLAGALLHLCYFREAKGLLELAFDQGYDSRDWIINMITALVALKDEEALQSLIYGIRTNLGEAYLQDFFKASEKLLAEIAEENRQNQESPPDNQKRVEDNDLKVVITDHKTDKSYTGTKLVNFPFLNLRLYQDLNTFSIDYYDDYPKSDYVDIFRLRYEMELKNPNIPANYKLSTHKFYFTICPLCGSRVLTNRKTGKELRCRACNTIFQTSEAPGPDYEEVLSQIHAYLGRDYLNDEYTIIVLFVVLREGYDEATLERIANKHQYSRLDFTDPVFEYALWGISQNIPTLGHDLMLAFAKSYKDTDFLMTRETPFDMQELVYDITKFYPKLESYSTYVNSRDAEQFIANLEAKYHDLKKMPDKKPLDYKMLLEHATKNKYAKDFDLILDSFLRDYPRDVEALFYSGKKEYLASNYLKAIELFERSLKIDPTFTQPVFYLYISYVKIEDEDNARKYRSMLQSLGLIS